MNTSGRLQYACTVIIYLLDAGMAIRKDDPGSLKVGVVFSTCLSSIMCVFLVGGYSPDTVGSCF